MILPVINLSDKCPTFLLHSPFVVLLRIKLLEGRDKMKRLLETLGKQVIIVTHSPQEAYLLCSSLRVMKNGDIIKSGKTEDVFHAPERLEAAELLGHRSFFSFENIGDKTLRARLLPSGVVLKATKPIPDDRTILSIQIDATKRGNDLRVKTLSVLKEEDGSILLLKSREDNNIWWKVRDNTPKEVDSISIDPDFYLFLK